MAAALAEPLDLNPASPAAAVAAMLETARTHKAAGRDRLALQALEAVLQARPHLAAVQLELAELRLALQQPELVVRQLQPLLTLQGAELSPAQRGRLEALLLQALLSLGRWEQAEPLLQRRLSSGRATAADAEALAQAAVGRGELAAAAVWQERAVQLDPDRMAAHRELGRLQQRLGRWPEALEAFARAISLAPLDGALEEEVQGVRQEALWARGEDALAREQWGEARAAFGALLDLQPQHPLAAARLVLLQQLDPQRLNLAADWLGAAAGEPDRLAVQQRLERFSRLLDRLQAAVD